VQIALASANRDERQFIEAADWNPRRERAAMVTFGLGLHGCLGMQLARLEMEVLAERLLERCGVPSLMGGSAIKIEGLTFRRPNFLPVSF